MPMPRLFTIVSGKIKGVILSIQSSAGAGDADKLIATDATGKIHNSFLPAGLGAATISVTSTEALAAGDFVEVYISSGAKCRKADATTLKRAKGFVLVAVGNGALATVYPLGETNNMLASLTPGAEYFLSLTAGGVTATPPSATGQMYQYLGTAISATELATVSDIAVELA
jgi:hypothetical protein